MFNFFLLRFVEIYIETTLIHITLLKYLLHVYNKYSLKTDAKDSQIDGQTDKDFIYTIISDTVPQKEKKRKQTKISNFKSK